MCIAGKVAQQRGCRRHRDGGPGAGATPGWGRCPEAMGRRRTSRLAWCHGPRYATSLTSYVIMVLPAVSLLGFFVELVCRRRDKDDLDVACRPGGRHHKTDQRKRQRSCSLPQSVDNVAASAICGIVLLVVSLLLFPSPSRLQTR